MTTMKMDQVETKARKKKLYEWKLLYRQYSVTYQDAQLDGECSPS